VPDKNQLNIPLMIREAFKFLKYDKAKSIGVVVGIVVSTFLIGQQIGILSFLMSLMGGLVNNSNQDVAQIWVVDPITQNVNELSRLDERKVYEIRSIEGVAETYPIVVGGAIATFSSGKTSPVNIVGSDPPLFPAGPSPAKIRNGDLKDLIGDAAVSADYFDAATFDNPTDIGTTLEINGKRAVIKLQTTNARGFGGSYFYTTLDRARYYTGYPQFKVSAIAVRVKKGYDPEQVCANINRSISDVRAWESTDLKNTTVRFITISSNIGSSVGSLVIFAIISGFFIIGLTLYSSAMDRIRDYGTLKALGASNKYITKLILAQSLIFSVSGFLIALSLLEGFRMGVARSGLIFTYPLWLLGALFLITLIISGGSTFFFSVRTINKVEPASVFRG
jgi:putative ABC transport system permease protein